MRLGSFTGSRAGEYAQTIGSHHNVSCIPNNPGAGNWSTDPIALIAEEFTFLSSSFVVLSPTDAILQPALAVEVHIRFRYDKSPRNCVTRKFRRTSHGFLCPVDAALSILAQSIILQAPSRHPIGIYRGHKGDKYILLKSYAASCCRGLSRPKSLS